MNVTDIDDKVNANEFRPPKQLKGQNPALTQELVDLAQTSWEKYLTGKILNNIAKSELAAQANNLPAHWSYVQARALDPSWAGAAQAKDEKFTMHMNTLKEATQSAIELARTQLNTGSTDGRNAELLIEASKDVIALELDEKLKETVSDPAIFRRLAAYWETSFMNDMARLRVRPPTTITRATEYVDQMVTFIEKVISNGYAYAGDDGNVWFDKAAFDGAAIKDKDLKHEYAKLAPWSRGNKALLAEGEGALTTHSSKRSQEDFALWKASKPGEPSWPSPWGRGRPGWHIECSVMASDVFGERMDIHSGGIDLLFPHHDNELAQSEAYHGNEQWVNYFLHTGHLHIAGLKMSKSLKNFITIETLLQTWSARQVRLSFLTQLWNNRLDWNESLQAEVRAKETTFDALVAEWDASPTPENGTMNYTKDESDLTSELYRQQQAFRVALCDSFNTPQALQALTDLVSATNIYLKRGRSSTNIYVVRQIASWVTKMLRMFGLGEGVPAEIGWGVASTSGEETSN
ncbi:14784_t:CDS:2, partial [Acaulospora colombiana]